MRKLPVILLMILLSSLLSCSKRDDNNYTTMTKAERLMDAAPDSALSLLNSIVSNDILTDEAKARYALLKTQAVDKNFIDETDDSLINIALEYYETHFDLRYRMLSRYYAGRIAYYGENHPAALMLFIKALDDAKDFGDDFWIGMAAGGASDVYNATFNDADAMPYSKICYDHMSRCGKKGHANWALFDLAVNYYNTGEYDKAEKYSLKLLDLAKNDSDDELFMRTLRLQGKMEIKRGRYEAGVNHWAKICCIDGSNHNDTLMLTIAQVLSDKIDKSDRI